jgi:hypothetical protein
MLEIMFGSTGLPEIALAAITPASERSANTPRWLDLDRVFAAGREQSAHGLANVDRDVEIIPNHQTC